jgi:hypothetical protein
MDQPEAFSLLEEAQDPLVLASALGLRVTTRGTTQEKRTARDIAVRIGSGEGARGAEGQKK